MSHWGGDDQTSTDTFDISTLLQTKTAFDGAITFDASSLQPEELPEEVKVALKEGVTVALKEQAQLKLLMGDYKYEFAEKQGDYLIFKNPTPVVPEPTPGTLSLLALAGLCARRRRK